MTATPNNAIPYVPENTIDPAAGLNLALIGIDALLQCAVLAITDTPPVGTPVEGDRYALGTAPTGAWAGQAGKLAVWTNGLWAFYPVRVVVLTADWRLYVNTPSGWQVPGSSAGWTAGTGTPNVGAFDAGTAALADVAGRVLALEQALFAAGLIRA